MNNFCSNHKFKRRIGDKTPKNLEWLAWVSFHLGDYKKALEVKHFTSICKIE